MRNEARLRRCARAAIAACISAHVAAQVCKRAPGVAYEAMECFGGNGFVEEGPMARLYRQSPLNAIWEVRLGHLGEYLSRDLGEELSSMLAYVAGIRERDLPRHPPRIQDASRLGRRHPRRATQVIPANASAIFLG